MSNGDHSEWGPYITEGVKWLLNGANAIALAAFAWMARIFHGHIAMLRNHEEKLNSNDSELGLLREQRTEIAKGLVGENLHKTFRAVDDQLDDLRTEDDRMDLRIDKMQLDASEKYGELRGDLKAINAKLEMLLRRSGDGQQK